ncbi:MAG: PfkB family carbohydrate kinase [Desulfatibacillaceae bacterium]
MTNEPAADILAAGEVLFDVFPEYERLGGAPFNFYFHTRALGSGALFASRIGKDRRGAEIADVFSRWRFPEDHLQRDLTRRTGYVMVSLSSADSPEYVIVEDVAYDYMEYTAALDALARRGVRLFYFGTLIQRSPRSAGTIDSILENLPEWTTRLCDLNLRPHCYDLVSVKKSLEHADILKINIDELGVLAHMLDMDRGRDECVAGLRDRYSIKWLSLTMGGDGSSLYTEDGRYDFTNTEQFEIEDTVGAGDAYTAMLALGYLKGWDPETMLDRASRFSGAICGLKGAVPSTADFYNPYRSWV